MAQHSNRKMGAKRKYEDPEEVQRLIDDFFEWCVNNPVSKPEMIKGGDKAGEVIQVKVPRMATKAAMCYHLGITNDTWDLMVKRARNGEYGENSDRMYEVLALARQRSYAEKSDLAASGAYPHAYVAKEQGLMDKTELDVSDDAKEVIYKIVGFGRKEDKDK